MKKNELINKTLAGLMIAAMTAGVCPTTAFAVTGGQVAKDGVYTAEAQVKSDDTDFWDDYKITVSLTVEDGKFKSVTVTPGDGYAKADKIYLEPAVSSLTSYLVGKEATENQTDKWDTMTGATCSSNAIKEASVAAIREAKEAATPVEVNTSNLEAAIAKAKGLTAADYTAESWAKLQTALAAADAALTAKESQKAVDTAAGNLTAAINALAKVNTEKLAAAIAKADALKDKEADYTADSWKTMQTALTEAKAALEAKESQEKVDAAETKLTKTTNELEKATVSTDVYVLMNIPYDKFYAAEGDDDVDAVTSATKQKTRNSRLTAGSYHVNSDGTDITGVVYPVKVSDISALEEYTKITDESKVDITVSGKGGEQTTTYEGKDALFESASYSYYILSEAPSYYKKATVNADGSLSFGKAEGTEVKTLSNVTADFKTSSKYGDYQINLSGLPDDITTVYGVVVGTKEGSNYGMRHLENIWKISELAWSTGFVTTSHSSPLRYTDYVNMMGQTINKITYYTDAGVYEIPVEIKVPVKFKGSLSVENGKASDGSVSATVEGLPADYEAEYSVKGLEDVKVENGKLTFAAEQARGGRYTLTVSDKKHKYADITTTFTLTTDATPITYDSEKASLVTAGGYTADDLAAYVKNIESVSVDGTPYAASGKGAVKIIKEDGSIDAAAKPFANAKDGQEFEIVVKATGYAKDYTFTYEDEDAYVLMNIPYSAFYKAEVNNDVDVDVFTSATLNKTRTASLAGGSYHVNADGSQIDGITFPVKVDKDVDLSKYTQVTDSDSVDITVTNRGQTSTTTYTGKDALFQNADYAYYNLTEVPSYYKEVSVDKDGNLTFGKTVDNVTTLEGLSAELSTETSYGDYQLDIDGLRDKLTELGVTNINGVVINTKKGSSYGLRHLENIWRMEELAWATGFTEAVHGCPTSSDHYKAMMGQTITSVTYYTDKGMYNIPLADIYVPVKFTHDLEVANAAITAGKTEVTVTGLPDDYAAKYKVDGLDGVSVQNGVLTFSNAKKGKYTLTISDKNGKYADITTEFELYTEAMPAAYDADKKALVKTADATDEEFADYINNITSVNVNGTDYKASGRGATVIINKDGSIKTDAAPFAEDDTFEITVSATGYLPQSFTYTTKVAPAPAEVNTEALEATIAKAEELKESDYTAESWKAMQTSLTSAKAALEAKESQAAVDAASASLQSSIDALKAATPAETEEETKDDKKDEAEAVDTAALEKVIATAKGLKKNDYTAATWSTLQTALTNAEKALDAKESQKSVDEAAKTLQAAIDGLKKAADTTATTDDKKNNNNNNNSTNKNNTTNKNTTTSKNSPKTGDPVSVLGLLGAAISSVGIGGLGLRLRKKSKREDEE